MGPLGPLSTAMDLVHLVSCIGAVIKKPDKPDQKATLVPEQPTNVHRVSDVVSDVSGPIFHDLSRKEQEGKHDVEMNHTVNMSPELEAWALDPEFGDKFFVPVAPSPPIPSKRSEIELATKQSTKTAESASLSDSFDAEAYEDMEKEAFEVHRVSRGSFSDLSFSGLSIEEQENKHNDSTSGSEVTSEADTQENIEEFTTPGAAVLSNENVDNIIAPAAAPTLTNKSIIPISQTVKEVASKASGAPLENRRKTIKQEIEQEQKIDENQVKQVAAREAATNVKKLESGVSDKNKKFWMMIGVAALGLVIGLLMFSTPFTGGLSLILGAHLVTSIIGTSVLAQVGVMVMSTISGGVTAAISFGILSYGRSDYKKIQKEVDDAKELRDTILNKPSYYNYVNRMWERCSKLPDLQDDLKEMKKSTMLAALLPNEEVSKLSNRRPRGTDEVKQLKEEEDNLFSSILAIKKDEINRLKAEAEAKKQALSKPPIAQQPTSSQSAVEPSISPAAVHKAEVADYTKYIETNLNTILTRYEFPPEMPNDKRSELKAELLVTLLPNGEAFSFWKARTKPKGIEQENAFYDAFFSVYGLESKKTWKAYQKYTKSNLDSIMSRYELPGSSNSERERSALKEKFLKMLLKPDGAAFTLWKDRQQSGYAEAENNFYSELLTLNGMKPKEKVADITKENYREDMGKYLDAVMGQYKLGIWMRDKKYTETPEWVGNEKQWYVPSGKERNDLKNNLLDLLLTDQRLREKSLIVLNAIHDNEESRKAENALFDELFDRFNMVPVSKTE